MSVRSGGHNVAGSALCDGGVVIDLAAMRSLMVDPERRRIHAQPGAVWGDFDSATQVHGLAAPAGVVSRTGVAGLAVGGGFGWLSRRWGLTSDNVVAMDVLLADGTRVAHGRRRCTRTCSGRIRGGGGNFGIVTRFEVELHELGTEVLAGPLLYPVDRAREVLHLYRETVVDAPRELSIMFVTRTAPEVEWVPPHLRGTDVLVLIPCYSGDPEAGEAALARLRTAIEPAADVVLRKPYVAHQMMFDSGVLPGLGLLLEVTLPPAADRRRYRRGRRAWLGEVVADRVQRHVPARRRDRGPARRTTTPRAAATPPTP